jgi:hypothetical protein
MFKLERVEKTSLSGTCHKTFITNSVDDQIYVHWGLIQLVSHKNIVDVDMKT